MNINEVRGFFPYLDTGKLYFNHASTAPQSKRVIAAINSFLKNASEGSIDDYPFVLKMVEETKAELAAYLNCNADRIAFLDNTTNGINVIAGGINWNKGDRIILNDAEFPGNVYPFMNLQKKEVKIDFIPSHNGVVTAEEIINNFSDSTRMVSVSQVQFLSGYRIDLNKLGSECKKRNIILSVDAIQGLGAVGLDVKKDNIDFLSCGTQKWMLGLQGLSFIYVSEELQQKMNPAYVGWLSVNDAWNLLDYNLSLKNSAEAFQTGTINTVGLIALNASIKLFKEFGYDEVEKHILNNSEFLIKRLRAIGLSPMADVERKYLSGIVTFSHKDAQNIFDTLERNNIFCAIREGAVRISPHFYNCENDIENLIKLIREII